MKTKKITIEINANSYAILKAISAITKENVNDIAKRILRVNIENSINSEIELDGNNEFDYSEDDRKKIKLFDKIYDKEFKKLE